MKKGPLEDDIEIGCRIRLQRINKGVSQTELGDACGISFQQIQKYEKGVNRVGGSRMKQIAAALGSHQPISSGSTGRQRATQRPAARRLHC